MSGKIDLASIAAKAAGAKVEPVPVPKPKNNRVEVSVYVDGREFRTAWTVPMLSSMTAGERSEDRLRATVGELLAQRFGRVENIK